MQSRGGGWEKKEPGALCLAALAPERPSSENVASHPMTSLPWELASPQVAGRFGSYTSEASAWMNCFLVIPGPFASDTCSLPIHSPSIFYSAGGPIILSSCHCQSLIPAQESRLEPQLLLWKGVWLLEDSGWPLPAGLPWADWWVISAAPNQHWGR